jgi:hypothetical protein
MQDETSGVNTHFSKLPPSDEGIPSNNPTYATGPGPSDRSHIMPEINEGKRIRVYTAQGTENVC